MSDTLSAQPAEIGIDEVCDRLLSADNIAVLPHSRPDGDCIGSAAGLVLALRAMGKRAYMVLSDTVPERLRFICAAAAAPGAAEADFAAPTLPIDFTPHFVVSVDCAETKLLGAYEQLYPAIDLKIDHHPPRAQYARENYVDSGAASSGEIIYRITERLGRNTPDVCEALYAAIISDTGSFRYSAVSKETHRIAGDIIAMGVVHDKIHDRLFGQRGPRELAALRLALNNLSYREIGGFLIALLAITNETKLEYELEDEDLGELNSFPRDIRGVAMGVTVKQSTSDPTLYKISVRSGEELDSSAVCSLMGGGGHVRASGGAFHAESMKDALETIYGNIEKVIYGLNSENSN